MFLLLNQNKLTSIFIDVSPNTHGPIMNSAIPLIRQKWFKALNVLLLESYPPYIPKRIDHFSHSFPPCDGCWFRHEYSAILNGLSIEFTFVVYYMPINNISVLFVVIQGVKACSYFGNVWSFIYYPFLKRYSPLVE